MVKRSIMKQQLTSNIAHELKTPISSVKGYLETVRNNRDLEPGRIRYFVDKAFMQTERLSLLVSDIALLNKIEESSELYPRGPVRVAVLIGEVAESLGDALHSKGITLDIKVDDWVVVNANTSLVFSIFRNLLENSVHYGGEGITVFISCYREEGGFYYFSFADNGPGVEEEHLSRFLSGFTGSTRAGHVKWGHRIGTLHREECHPELQGEISARKRPGGGLEFLFTLPR